MKGIKAVIYETNGQSMFIDIGDKIQFISNDISCIISEKSTLEYLKNLFYIIDDWELKYVNPEMIDGDNWKLSIIYFNGNKKEYSGKSSFPNNFEAFERLNQELIDGVYNG